MNHSLNLHKQSTMQLFIFFTFIIGVCYSIPLEQGVGLQGSNDKWEPIAAESTVQLEAAQNEAASDQPKYSCSIFDPVLVKNCSDEADYYLDEARKQCCHILVANTCKIRLLKQVCSEEEYIKKLNSLESNNNLVFEETPDCPKNANKNYCDISAIESLTGLPPNWVYTGAVVFLVVIFLLAIIFGIKYC